MSMSGGSPAGARGGGVSRGHAVVLIILATLALLLFIIATLLELQTSIAFILRQSSGSIKPDLNVLMIIPNLIHGNLSQNDFIADFFALAAEVALLFCAYSYEHSHNAVRETNHHLTQVYIGVIVVVAVFQFWSDFRYAEGIPSGAAGQLGFAIAVSFCVFFCGIISAKLYAIGFSSMRH